jgi:hypothetical protein
VYGKCSHIHKILTQLVSHFTSSFLRIAPVMIFSAAICRICLLSDFHAFVSFFFHNKVIQTNGTMPRLNVCDLNWFMWLLDTDLTLLTLGIIALAQANIFEEGSLLLSLVVIILLPCRRSHYTCRKIDLNWVTSINIINL